MTRPGGTEFVFPGCWHFDNGTTSKIDDVLNDHGLHVLLLVSTWISFNQASRGAPLLPQATVASILGVLSSKDEKIKYP